MKDNKSRLYEKIMNEVSKDLKKTLDEYGEYGGNNDAVLTKSGGANFDKIPSVIADALFDGLNDKDMVAAMNMFKAMKNVHKDYVRMGKLNHMNPQQFKAAEYIWKCAEVLYKECGEAKFGK